MPTQKVSRRSWMAKWVCCMGLVDCWLVCSLRFETVCIAFDLTTAVLIAYGNIFIPISGMIKFLLNDVTRCGEKESYGQSVVWMINGTNVWEPCAFLETLNENIFTLYYAAVYSIRRVVTSVRLLDGLLLCVGAHAKFSRAHLRDVIWKLCECGEYWGGILRHPSISEQSVDERRYDLATYEWTETNFMTAPYLEVWRKNTVLDSNVVRFPNYPYQYIRYASYVITAICHGYVAFMTKCLQCKLHVDLALCKDRHGPKDLVYSCICEYLQERFRKRKADRATFFGTHYISSLLIKVVRKTMYILAHKHTKYVHHNHVWHSGVRTCGDDEDTPAHTWDYIWTYRYSINSLIIPIWVWGIKPLGAIAITT